MAKEKVLCFCKRVTKEDVRKAVLAGADGYKKVQKATGAGSKCGKCEEDVRKAVKRARKEREMPKAKSKKDKGGGAKQPTIRLDAMVLECRDPLALAGFYSRLLGCPVSYSEEDNGWVDLALPGGVKLAFQQNPEHVPPVWPDEAGQPGQQAHLDFAVNSKEDMDAAERHAVACGARRADTQFGGDRFVTLIDPAGHPFCFVIC